MSYESTTSIRSILVDAMDTQLNKDLVTNVSDETKAGLVRVGKLQDDPTENIINILIHHGDKDWKDGPYFVQKGLEVPTYEIGGTQWWMRRFIIEFQLFFDGELDREPARLKANIALSRCQQSLINMDIPTDADYFGEQAHELQIADAYLDEGGGEGEFIWRGKTFVEILTSKRRERVV